MSEIDLRHIGRFFALVLFQGLLLKQAVLFDGLAISFIYIFFILKLPLDMNRVVLLLICFTTGLTIDFFYNTFGLHAAASVFLGFVRPGLLNLIQPRDGYDSGQEISISVFGFNWFFTYAFFLTFAHHFYLFFLEIFSFSHFGHTLMQVILSSIYTFLIILLIHLIFTKRR